MMVALAFLFVLGYIGLELAFGGYLFSYAVKYCPLQFTESNAVFLTSGTPLLGATKRLRWG